MYIYALWGVYFIAPKHSQRENRKIKTMKYLLSFNSS